MSFERKLNRIKDQLNSRSTNDRKEIYKYHISKRLNESLIAYRQNLENSVKYLNNRKPENVLKEL